MAELRLEELSASNIVAANTLTLKPGQEQFVAPVSHSSPRPTSTPPPPGRAWCSTATRSSGSSGQLRSREPHEEFRGCIWRINVAADAQGTGVGRFAVLALADEARSRGFDRLTVMWEPGEDGPGGVLPAVGFDVIGETQYGENIAALAL